MAEEVQKENPSIQATEWVVGGGWMTRRDSLSPTDEESWFSLWFKKYGSLEDFPWEAMGYKNGPPRSFPWRAFGLNPFKKCPSCGYVHEEARSLEDEAFFG